MFTSVPLPKDEDLPSNVSSLLSTLPPINVFRMLANVPQSYPAFQEFARTLFQEGKLSPRIREIAVLRQAHIANAPYEWHQHTFIAKANGVTEKEIAAIKSEKTVQSLGEEENFACLISDELTQKATLTTPTFEKAFKRYEVSVACELILVISYFNMLSRFLNATRIQIEDTNPLEGLADPTKTNLE